MHQTWTLAKRELNAAFDSPAAYVVLVVFLLITGWFFGSTLFLVNKATLQSVFDYVPLIFLFVVPALTMATFAEERRAGTLELLLTMPIKDWQVIVGKLLAVVLLLWTAIGLTLIYAITLAALGDLDTGATVGGYFGLMLLAVAAAAIGLFASSLTRNQIVAFILGFAILFVFYMLSWAAPFLPSGLSGLFEYLSLDYHYRNLLRGVIDTRDVLYFLSLTCFAGLLTAYNLARRPE